MVEPVAPLSNSRTPWALLLATVLAFVPVVIGAHLFLPDDVYFYLKIAREIVEGDGSTFNGLVPTNGYHPLWMLICILERVIVGPDKLSLLSIHIAVSGLCNLASIVIAHRLARHLGFDGFVAAGAVGFYLAYNVLGSEMHLGAPLVMLSALLVLRSGPGGWRDLVAIGVVLGLTMLARLDNVFVAATMAACAAAGRAPRDLAVFVRRGLLVGLPAVGVVAPYMAWNWFSFGHLVPISGAIKSGLAEDPHFPTLSSQMVLLMLGSVVSWVWAWRTVPGMRRNTWLAVATGALLHAAYVLFRMENIWTWYFTSELVATALALEAGAFWAVERLQPRARWPRHALRRAMVLPLLLVAWLYLVHLRRGGERWWLEMARWLDENLPPGAAIAASFSPGGIGYFSEHPVFALDGLTGDFAFHERAAEHGLAEALAELGVQYIYTFGPRSRWVSDAARETERRGHAGEGIGIYGTLLDSGEFELRAVGVVSPILGRSLGRICLGPEWLVREGLFADLRVGIWKLPPGGGCATVAGFSEAEDTRMDGAGGRARHASTR